MSAELTLYSELLTDIKVRVRQAQHRAALSANAEMILLYWDIGRMIAARQKQEGWGKGVIPRLAVDLRNELPEEKGFSESNLKRMVQFSREYPGLFPIGARPVPQLPNAPELPGRLPTLDEIGARNSNGHRASGSRSGTRHKRISHGNQAMACSPLALQMSMPCAIILPDRSNITANPRFRTNTAQCCANTGLNAMNAMCGIDETADFRGNANERVAVIWRHANPRASAVGGRVGGHASAVGGRAGIHASVVGGRAGTRVGPCGGQPFAMLRIPVGDHPHAPTGLRLIAKGCGQRPLPWIMVHTHPQYSTPTGLHPAHGIAAMTHGIEIHHPPEGPNR
jgi:hypothetical protein